MKIVVKTSKATQIEANPEDTAPQASAAPPTSTPVSAAPEPSATTLAPPASVPAPAPAAAPASAPASSVTDPASDVYGQAASNLVAGNNLEGAVQQNHDMGGGTWDRDTVVRALHAAFNNLHRAVEYLCSDIPEQAGVRPVARAHESGQVAKPLVQPAPVPSSGPNANLLDLSPQGLPDMGSNAAGGGNLDFLRNNPEFQHLRAMIKANPQLMKPMLRELGKLNLHLLRLIQEHQADFVRLINEPIKGGEGNLLGQLASGMPQAITVTPEERKAIERGIPEQAGVPPVAQAHASGQVANPPAQPPLPVQPAPVPSSGPNANLLDLSLQGLPDMGSNAAGGGNLDFLRNSEEFQHLRAMIMANPQLMQPMLRELGKLNLHLLRLIQLHPADFVRLINEPIEGGEGNLLGQLASGMPQAMTVTPEECEAIERDSGSPSNSLEPSHVEKDPIEATENDGNSNSTCSTSPVPNLRSSFFAVNGVIFSKQSPRIGRACNFVALVGVTLPFTVLVWVLLPPILCWAPWACFAFTCAAFVYQCSLCRHNGSQ